MMENGFTEVYANAKVKDGSAAAELMEVFTRDDAYSDRFPVTSLSKHRYKETEEGQRVMCEIMERIAEEERRQGRKQGRREGEAYINRLYSILIREKRYGDLERATGDPAYRKKLMRELLP